MKFIIGLYVRCIYVYRALKVISKPHLGDIVLYKGKRHALIQGVNSPYWNLLDLSPENLAKKHRDVEKHVHMSAFKLQPLYKRFIFSFFFTYRFFMKAWYSIDVRNKGQFIFNGKHFKATRKAV